MADRIITDMRDLKSTVWCDWQIGGDGTSNATWALIVSTYSNPLQPITKGIAFYIRSQFSRYLKAGYTVIYNNLDNVVTAISPDEKELVIVVSNQNTYTQKYSFDVSKFSNFGKIQQVRTRVQESLGIKNSVTLFNITGTSIEYDALSESVTTFIVPVNQTPEAINEVKENIGDMYYSNGFIHTEFMQEATIFLSVYNTLGQLIKTFNDVPSKGIRELNLKNGFYIVNARVGNNSFSCKIEVY